MDYVYLYNLYAGSGKTYYIIHTLIPSIKHLKYIVISNTHKTLLEYKQYGYGDNCKVVMDQSINIDDDVNIIIVDEYYQISKKVMQFILQYANSKIYLFGDDRQLPDTIAKFKFSKYLMKTFAYIDNGKEWINRRNHFTFGFYDKIINEYTYGDILSIIDKYSMKNPNDAEYIVAYRNSTLEKYKVENCKYYYAIGSGLPQSLKDIGLYGDCVVELVLINEYECIIKFNNITHLITPDQFTKYFNQNNLSTIHRLQGKSIKSFYWCKEDNDYLNCDIGRIYCYVIISRLKTKVFPDIYLQSILNGFTPKPKLNKIKIKLKSRIISLN